MLQIKYGGVDITEKALFQCVKQNVLFLPKTEQARTNIFGDPAVGVLKAIQLLPSNVVLEACDQAYIDLNTNAIYATASPPPKYIQAIYPTLLQQTIQKYNSKETVVWKTDMFEALKANPEILNDILLIVMENNYTALRHKQQVDVMVMERGFEVEFSEGLVEVWKLPST